MCVCVCVCVYISYPQKEDWSRSPGLPLLEAKAYSTHLKQSLILQSFLLIIFKGKLEL